MFLKQHIARMYVTTLIVLILVVALAGYFLHEFPYSVIEAVIACSAIELFLYKFIIKRQQKFPFSAIITGFVIGGVAPSNAPVLALVVASAIAIASRSFIRFKGSNIFNPAALGLLISLFAFGIGTDWWVASAYPVYGVLLSFSPLLVIAAYEARRLYAGISFVAVSLVAALLASHSLVGLTSLSAFVTIIASLNYFLAFIMVAEPKTSPIRLPAQLIYGGAIAALVTIFVLLKVPYGTLFALLVGNAAYLAYRVRSGSR